MIKVPLCCSSCHGKNNASSFFKLECFYFSSIYYACKHDTVVKCLFNKFTHTNIEYFFVLENGKGIDSADQFSHNFHGRLCETGE